MRNISPHVNIYKFPITAISSIATRLSGLYLSGAYVGFGMGTLCGINFVEKYKELENYKRRMINYTLITPSVYHTFGGMRHFIWNKYPSLLTNNKVAKSSYILFGATIGTSIMVENYLNIKDQ